MVITSILTFLMDKFNFEEYQSVTAGDIKMMIFIMEGVILTYFIFTFLRLSYFLSSANTYLSSYNLITKTLVFAMLAYILTFQQTIIDLCLTKQFAESEIAFTERKI